MTGRANNGPYETLTTQAMCRQPIMSSPLVVNKLSPAKCVKPVVFNELLLASCHLLTCRDTVLTICSKFIPPT